MNFGGTVKLNPVGVFVLFGLSFIFLLYILAGRRSDKEINLKDLLKAAINVAEEGGHTIHEFRSKNLNEKSKGKTKEGAFDLVTDADYGSHCIMYYSLLITFPSLKVISEENHSLSECQPPVRLNEILTVNTKDENINEFNDVSIPLKDVTIWIDPLDATKEFTEELYQYVTTMVCVAIRGKPIIGVIHQPFDKHSTTSWYGLGEENPLTCSLKKLNSRMSIPLLLFHNLMPVMFPKW